MTRRHVETIFCDNIRQEMGNKFSYMGVYTGNLLLPHIPLTLPKLCLALKIVTPASQPFRNIAIVIKQNDDVIAETHIDADEIKNFTDNLPEESTEDDAVYFQAVGINLVFSPLEIKQACLLKVLVKADEDELKGAGLRIMQNEMVMQ